MDMIWFQKKTKSCYLNFDLLSKAIEFAPIIIQLFTENILVSFVRSGSLSLCVSVCMCERDFGTNLVQGEGMKVPNFPNTFVRCSPYAQSSSHEFLSVFLFECRRSCSAILKHVFSRLAQYRAFT